MSRALRDPRVDEYRRLAREYEKRAGIMDDLKWKIGFFRLAKQYRELVVELERIPSTPRPMDVKSGT
jgi:hypothetical protein